MMLKKFGIDRGFEEEEDAEERVRGFI